MKNFNSSYMQTFLKSIIVPLMIIIPICTMMMTDYLMIWFFMEISTFLFLIYYMINENWLKYKIFIYYFTQSISSMMILFALIQINWINNIMSSSFDVMIIILNLTMMLKLSMFPLHNWYVELISKSNWTTNLFLMTIQKLIPLILFKNFIDLNVILITTCLYIMMIPTILNENNLKKIMSYSSMLYSMWFTIMIYINPTIFIMFFISYTIMMILLTNLFQKFKINYISQMNLISKLTAMLSIMIMLTLTMLPPFMMFFLKWIFMKEMLKYTMYYISLMLIMYSWMFIFIYIRMFLFSLMNMNLYKNEYYKNNMMSMIWISLMTIPIILMIIYS